MIFKKDIVNLLEEIADILEFKSENKFKVSAFRNGANAIRQLDDDVIFLVKNKQLDSVKGIGKGIQLVIYEYVDNESSPFLEELKKDYPHTLFDVFSIRGLGPKKIALLYNQLKIGSIEELETACRNNSLQDVKGFGKSTQEKILAEIELVKRNKKFIHMHRADKIVQKISEMLASINLIAAFQISGEIRRNCEVVSKIEFVIQTNDEKSVIEELENSFEGKYTHSTFSIENLNIPVFFYIVKDKNEFDKKLFLTTGSIEFLEEIGYPDDLSTEFLETSYFEKRGIDYLAPEMREMVVFNYPVKTLLVESDLNREQFNGFLHFHTKNSDGMNTLEEMVLVANSAGYGYFAVCDHSKSAFYASGLTEDRILLQKKEVAEVSSKLRLPVYQGIESDILNDGSLDYEQDFLENFDFIVASIHSNFNMKEDEMTARIIKAVENPKTNVLGHPTGRLLLYRESFPVNIKKVIDACSRNNVAIEINANPHRLDLDWRNILYARDKGCIFSINQDAHSVDEVKYIKYGINIARKGGIQSSEVLNCFTKEKFESFIKKI